MALEKFDIGALATIDQGRIAEAFTQALKRCESDCKDRPMLRKDRKVTIEACPGRRRQRRPARGARITIEELCR